MSGKGLYPCASCIWLPHPAPTSAQDGLDPLQLALVVYFLSSLSTKTSLALAVGTTLVPTSTFTSVHIWLQPVWKYEKTSMMLMTRRACWYPSVARSRWQLLEWIVLVYLGLLSLAGQKCLQYAVMAVALKVLNTPLHGGLAKGMNFHPGCHSSFKNHPSLLRGMKLNQDWWWCVEIHWTTEHGPHQILYRGLKCLSYPEAEKLDPWLLAILHKSWLHGLATSVRSILLGDLDSCPTIVLTLASSNNPFFPAKGKCLTLGNDHSRKLSGME